MVGYIRIQRIAAANNIEPSKWKAVYEFINYFKEIGWYFQMIF